MATIMIVDDFPVTQKVLAYQLCQRGHKIVTANNGREAIKVIVDHPVDLLILDLAMPEMDGMSVLRYLRADRRFSCLPIIILTASGKEQDRRLAISEGVDAFLTKPTTTWELNTMVSNLLADHLPLPMETPSATLLKNTNYRKAYLHSKSVY
ncbi:response regulator [bacterium]|nr:response regulator [bacterium]